MAFRGPLSEIERPDTIYHMTTSNRPRRNSKLKVEIKTYQVPYGGSTVNLVVENRGEGRPFLLLHGGAGPASMGGFANLLAEKHQVRVLTPTHPGFARTPRPEALNSAKGLAKLYAKFLEEARLSDVTVIGNSIGGWIASELALLAPSQVSRVVLVSPVGIEVTGYPVTDVSKLTIDQVMSLSYYNPKPFRIDPSTLTEEQRMIAGSNRAALQVYAPRLTDPGLVGRLAEITIPVLVISGEADRIVLPEYGRVWSESIPGSKFKLLPRTGHVPQVETPELLLDAIWDWSP
jgi:pimeloyl-ACP methyl ester carboxylesterase